MTAASTDSSSGSWESRDRPAPILPVGMDPVAALRRLAGHDTSESARITVLRVLWLRQDHPDARVTTELVELHEELVVFKATISLPEGASATGYAAESGRFGENRVAAIERAETRATARALDMLGYVLLSNADEAATSTIPAREDAHIEQVARRADAEPTTSAREDAPPVPTIDEATEQRRAQEHPPAVVDALRKAAHATRQPMPADEPVAEQAAVDTETDERDEEPAETTRDRAQERPEPARALPRIPEGEPDDTPLEDYSWTAFWRVARPKGLDKQKVEERIGRSIQDLTPAQVRIALEETGFEF